MQANERYDDVDFFGLDAYGMPAGVNPMWGALAGSAVGTLTAVGITQFTDKDRWAELIGFGASALAGGIMAIFPATRNAGWTAMAVGLANNGVRAAYGFLSEKQAVKDETGKSVTQKEDPTAKGIGATIPQRIPALGAVVPQKVPALGAPTFRAGRYGTSALSRAA